MAFSDKGSSGKSIREYGRQNGQPSQHVARYLNNIVRIVCNRHKNPEPVIGSGLSYSRRIGQWILNRSALPQGRGCCMAVGYGGRSHGQVVHDPSAAFCDLINGGHHQIRAAHRVTTGEHLWVAIWKAYWPLRRLDAIPGRRARRRALPSRAGAWAGRTPSPPHRQAAPARSLNDHRDCGGHGWHRGAEPGAHHLDAAGGPWASSSTPTGWRLNITPPFLLGVFTSRLEPGMFSASRR